MVKKGAHIYTQKKLRILLARKKILSKYTEQKKINLKKEKVVLLKNVLSPSSDPKLQRKKRTQKILLLLSSENLKKKSLHKNGIL